MPLYDPAPNDVSDLVADVIAGHYPDLDQAGVTIGCLQATAPVSKKGIRRGFALNVGGHVREAIVDVNDEKTRTKGAADATIVIDGDRWPDWNADQQRALIDLMLYTLQLRRDKKTGEVLEDSLGRPLLKKRPPDWEIRGYAAIAERHGAASFEVQAAVALKTKFGQLLWDFADADHEPRSGRRGSSGCRKAARASGVAQEAATAPLEGQGFLIGDLDRPEPYGPQDGGYDGYGEESQEVREDGYDESQESQEVYAEDVGVGTGA